MRKAQEARESDPEGREPDEAHAGPVVGRSTGLADLDPRRSIWQGVTPFFIRRCIHLVLDLQGLTPAPPAPPAPSASPGSNSNLARALRGYCGAGEGRRGCLAARFCPSLPLVLRLLLVLRHRAQATVRMSIRLTGTAQAHPRRRRSSVRPRLQAWLRPGRCRR